MLVKKILASFKKVSVELIMLNKTTDGNNGSVSGAASFCVKFRISSVNPIVKLQYC